jgi:hypothetical protein
MVACTAIQHPYERARIRKERNREGAPVWGMRWEIFARSAGAKSHAEKNTQYGFKDIVSLTGM